MKFTVFAENLVSLDFDFFNKICQQSTFGAVASTYRFPRRSPLIFASRRISMERRLAAILAADVVGYSRLIRADEEGI